MCLLLAVQSGERRQKRRVYINDTISKSIDQRLAHNTHETGQHYKPHTSAFQFVSDLFKVNVFRTKLLWDHYDTFYMMFLRPLDGKCIRFISYKNAHCRLYRSSLDSVYDRLEI